MRESGISEGLPKISIVTHSYNQGQFLEECIDSVLSQNYPNLEYVIMDGGSTDNSVAIIKKYANHLAYWQSQRGDAHTAVNQGFAKTSGDVMAWLDPDDKYHADALWYSAYTFVEYPDVEWFTGKHNFFDPQGNLSSVLQRLLRWSRRGVLEMKLDARDTLFVQKANTFWRRYLWEQAGAFIDGAFELASDFELWVRFLRHARLFSVDAIFGGLRIHEGKIVVRNRQEYIREVAAILERERQLIAGGEHTEFLSEPVPISLYDKAVSDYRASIDDEYRDKTDGHTRGQESLSSGKSPAGGKAAPAPSVVAVATSIAPFNLEKQRAAIDSWIKCGFRVVSLNVPAEIERLRGAFPDIEFVPVTRDGRSVTGRSLIYFDDILAHLGTLKNDVVGIVNSDIYLMPDRESVEEILRQAHGCMVCGSRVDVESLDQLMGPVYRNGFDLFFFDTALLACYPRSGLMLGMPWWDYWAPMMPLLRGLPIKYLGSPFGYHVTHETNYPDNLLKLFRREFSEKLFPHFPNQIARNRFIRTGLQFLYDSSTHIRVPHLEVAALNARGEAYLASGEPTWAETYFRRTLERDDRFLPAHNNLAVLYWNEGRVDDTMKQLDTALKIAPTDRITVMNAGAVLSASGKTTEARNLYDTYLACCPDDMEARLRIETLTAVSVGAVQSPMMLCRVPVRVLQSRRPQGHK